MEKVQPEGLTTRQAFEKLITKRGWYNPLNIPKTSADSYGRNFRIGKITLDKMEEILEQAGGKVVQEKLWDL